MPNVYQVPALGIYWLTIWTAPISDVLQLICLLHFEELHKLVANMVVACEYLMAEMGKLGGLVV